MREIEWNREKVKEYKEWDKEQTSSPKGKYQQAQYRAQAQPRSNPGPVQAQVRAQAQYRAQAQTRTHPIHARGASNHRRVIIEGRRGSPPHRVWSERNVKRGRSPNLDDERYGSIRGRGVRMRVDRSYSSRGRPSHGRTYR